MVENIAYRGKFSGRAIHSDFAAAKFTVRRVPVEVASYKEIQLAIVVVVGESSGRRPSTTSHARFLRNVGECAVPVVVIEHILSIVSHIDIRIAVIFIVADGNTHAVVTISDLRQSSLFGNIRKGTVAILPVETVPIFWIAPVKVNGLGHWSGHSTSIAQANI